MKRDSSRTRRAAFSLLEVVAAVGIFVIGMVAVLGLFAPVTRSVANVGDSEAAARVADAVRARLSLLARSSPAGWERVRSLVQLPADVRKNDADGTYNPNDGTKHPAVLFGKLNGEVGIYESGTGRNAWFDSLNARVNDADKFFEIALIRNEELSPVAGDDTAAMLAFNIRVRWPAFSLTSASTAVQTGQQTGGTVPFDQSKKQVMFFTGSVMR